MPLAKTNDNTAGSSCLTLDRLTQYVKGSLPPSELLIIENHLSACPFCSDALDGLMTLPNMDVASKTVDHLNDQLTKHSHRATVKSATQISRRSFRLYALAAAIAAAIAIVMLMPRNDPFKELQHLEYLVNQFQPRAHNLKVIQPQNDATVRGILEFEWKYSDGPLVLELFNNQEQVLISVEVNVNRFVFKDHLPAGLYYWKLLDGEELLHVGKFLVARD